MFFFHLFSFFLKTDGVIIHKDMVNKQIVKKKKNDKFQSNRQS